MDLSTGTFDTSLGKVEAQGLGSVGMKHSRPKSPPGSGPGDVMTLKISHMSNLLLREDDVEEAPPPPGGCQQVTLLSSHYVCLSGGKCVELRNVAAT